MVYQPKGQSNNEEKTESKYRVKSGSKNLVYQKKETQPTSEEKKPAEETSLQKDEAIVEVEYEEEEKEHLAGDDKAAS